MPRLLIPLVTLGLFAALASYSLGRYEPGHTQASARHAAPVILSRDAGLTYQTPHDCGEDWLCLVAWSEEQHPAKKRRRS